MFRPLNKNILLEKQEIKENSNSLYLGINNSNLYKVIAVGKEVLEVKVLDNVYVNEENIVQIRIDNKNYFVTEEKNIYMVKDE